MRQSAASGLNTDFNVRDLPEKGRNFTIDFDNGSLKPFSRYRVRAKAKILKDEFGRPLARPIDMTFSTDHLRPQLSLYKDMSVLEKGLDTDLPVFAANIDRIDLKYQTFTAAGKSCLEVGHSSRPEGP